MSTTWDQSQPAISISKSAAPLSLGRLLWKSLVAIGSLKITVTMFALGIIILLVGTLAQDEQTLEDVKRDYFNSWIAIVRLDVFFPVTIFDASFFQKAPFLKNISIPIPGGATIGFILFFNLIAAKLTRFSIHAKGKQFVAGLFFLLFGLATLFIVVIGAHLGDGLQGEPPFSYDLLWWFTKITVWLLAAVALTSAIAWPSKMRLIQIVVWSLATILILISLILLFWNDQVRIPDPGLRIVWQLAKSFLVGFTLLAGMVLLFGKRGGNVLIHFGVGLLMLSQFMFGDQQVEERVTLLEGESTNIAYRTGEVELAITELASSENPKAEEKVYAFDASFLEPSALRKKPLQDPALPFDILGVQWMPNSTLENYDPDFDNLATHGLGLRRVAKPAEKNGGASSQTNIASAYVTLLEKNSNRPLGTYLLSQFEHDSSLLSKAAAEEVVEVNGKSFALQLRFRQTIKDYQITLVDVKREDYRGTNTPRDYSSDVYIASDDGKELQKGHIWMNNPLRFRGETFYQSGHVAAEDTDAGVEQSTLQVVTNAGWLIPYICCVLCGLGMLVHFSTTFVRFAMRYEKKGQASLFERFRATYQGPSAFLAPAAGLGLVALIAIAMATPRSHKSDDFDWTTASQLPMLHEGRIKPLDSVARSLLQTISNKTSLTDEEGKKYSASEWLLSTMAGVDWTRQVNTIRIEAKEVVNALGLDNAREGLRFSYEEVEPNMKLVYDRVNGLDRNKEKEWSFTDKKFVELTQRIGVFESIVYGYAPLIPKVPTQEEGEDGIRRFQTDLDFYAQLVRMVERNGTAAIIPPTEPDPEKEWKSQTWHAYGPALFHWLEDRRANIDHDDRFTQAFGAMLRSIKNDTARDFNMSLKKFKGMVAGSAPNDADLGRVRLEAWYNQFGPVNLSAFLYVLVGIVAAINVAFPSPHVRRATFWMCFGILLIHTLAIVCRIYISQRPPVINLYSSAVFVGWFIVLAGLIMEALAPLGLGVIAGSIAGFCSLMVAYSLDTSDSMPVLQAVLDTQFWLATHVTCITLGYGATFAAGAVGIAYLVMRIAIGIKPGKTPAPALIKIFDTFTYGLVCAALFFSFVGTVLGGLWGDDSWGRFWGWDPKENGALMIVLWNAILLHARWDKMVSHRGFALLAIGGNIITSWSWFGTNQLGIGLHSYGFNNTILQTLAGVVISQLVLILAGWWIVPANPSTSET